MSADRPLRVPGRPLVWLALAVALLSAARSLYLLEHLPGKEVSGLCSAVIREAEGDSYLLDEVTWLDGGARQAPSGRVLLEAEPYAYPLLAGHRVTVEIVLHPLEPPVNPNGWDGRLRFLLSDVVYTASGRILSHSGEPTLSLRERARTAFRAHVDALWGEEGGLIAALLLGMRDELSDQLLESFQRSGAAHLLAVSGLHVGFVMALVSFCFRWMRRNSWPQIALILLCMAGYGLLAVSAFSVFRASAMLAAALVARRLGRRADGPTSLAIAVIAALLTQPRQILRLGFLMSVCAVLGILFLYRRLDALLRRFVRADWLRGTMAMTLSANLGLLPVQVFSYHSIATLSLLTNIAAVPLAAGIVMLGLPTVLAHMLCPALALAPAFTVRLLARTLILLCDSVAEVPFSLVHVPSPSIFVLLCYLGLLFLLSPYFMEFRRHLRRAMLPAVLGAGALALMLWLPGAQPRFPEATFFSVGTADCALLRSGSSCFLIDTGWSGSQVVSAVNAEGLSLDAVILTHKDADHAGGLMRVLQEVPVATVLVPLGMPLSGFAQEMALAEEKGIPVRTLRQGDVLTIGEFEVRVLSPPYVRIGQDNADSLVLDVSCGEARMLFLSDVPQETEERLDLPGCDLIKLAHHGSATSTSSDMLRATAPKAAVLSVGTPNRYGFPAAEVLDRLRAAGVAAYRTDECGAVIAEFTRDGLRVRAYEPPSLWTQWTGLD